MTGRLTNKKRFREMRKGGGGGGGGEGRGEGGGRRIEEECARLIGGDRVNQTHKKRVRKDIRTKISRGGKKEPATEKEADDEEEREKDAQMGGRHKKKKEEKKERKRNIYHHYYRNLTTTTGSVICQTPSYFPILLPVWVCWSNVISHSKRGQTKRHTHTYMCSQTNRYKDI